MKNTAFFLLLFWAGISAAFAQGVKGTVRGGNGEVLPYAAIQVKGTRIGTMANGEGGYEISLAPGTYEIQFQYLNHQTLSRKVEVGSGFEVVDVRLEEIAVKLAEVRVGRTKEDPAYTIMRKAIATARFHLLETESWTARTYVKGTFRIDKIPGLLENALKKENLQVGTTYILESINDLSFRQPNTVQEKVVSIRSNLPPGSNPLINFARLSFYNPSLGDLVSPLSPKAFGYYKFEYLGFFNDKGVLVNRIRVMPRSPGLDILDGTINLIEDTWSIHSLEFSFRDDAGTQYSIRQLFSPFENIWMPVQLETNAKISLFGAKGETRYVTSVRNYNVKIDPRYHRVPQVVDEKIDKEIASSLKQKALPNAAPPQQATRKQLRQMVKELEKEDRRERKKQGEDVTVTRSWSFQVDTLARKRPEAFWDGERQVPLTKLETTGFRRADSLYKANEVKIRKDSIRNLPKFKVAHLLEGHTYNYGKRREMEWYPRQLVFESPVMDLTKMEFFNAVEGYVVKSRLTYVQRLSRSVNWNASVFGRYSFARERLNGGISAGFNTEKWRLDASAGRNVYQFNASNPIRENINTFYTLFRENNYLKFYEKQFVSATVFHRLSPTLSAQLTVDREKRFHLVNHERTGWVDRKDHEFMSNDPESLELNNQTAFPNHQATVLTGVVTFRPLAKSAVFNDRKVVLGNNSPVITGLVKWGNTGGNTFTRVELGVRDEFKLLRNAFSYVVRGGYFPQKPSWFMDYRHFDGNETLFQPPGTDHFSVLPYYRYSTAGRYAEAHANYQFRKFLLTQILPVRLYGIKEDLFAHYVTTQQVHHVEIGYGFSGLMKLLGAEVVTSFQNGSYYQTGFRVRMGL
ncbi:DUF5686 and carboxypeptidase regulatory-like domain-containing protein [Siphonobacter aquaeclarae]|uniref:CarboxypepD_reg-like domain-containing protein n=1 Tax=Siphonobacter aquaeclarae TaxID=563176 RepID=A0A1G9RWX0_9BACT|nr:DUF5686 and carboxypeptidase regulatory-like domain-containing protein [Siphonobacter aquaeclarae]SDM27726.1 CarboxypepD_reg-like domain-containing protein [Siphonobacter aquaeclarae]